MIAVEGVLTCEKHGFVRHGDPDLYSMMAAGSPVLLDYGNFTLPQVESVYQLNPLDSPGQAWLHVQGQKKISMIVQCLDYPAFALSRYMHGFKHLEYKYDDLKVPHEPYADQDHREKAFIQFLEHIRQPDSKIPQVLML